MTTMVNMPVLAIIALVGLVGVVLVGWPTFVGYLRIALAAGVPGWQDNKRYASLVKRLSDGLAPF